MTTRPVPLLARHSKTAPRFDPSKPLSLWDYFWDYEILAEAAQLDEATKIKKSIIYLTRDEADLWESLDEYSNAKDWTDFKNTVLSFYPGSVPKDRWTLVDLSALCKEQKSKRVQTRGDFAEFNRQFSTVVNSLINKGLVSELERKKLFWSALDQGFKDRLIRKIELTKPDYTARTILTLAEINHAAGLVLDGTVAETSAAISESTKKATPASSLEPAKLEPFDIERFTHQTAVMMAKIVETAVATALSRATSVYGPSLQTNNDRNGLEIFNSTHANGMPRNVPPVQKVDDPADSFSNSATIALSNTDAIQTSSNLVEVRTVESIETHVEPKEGLDAFIAALQKFSLPGNKEDEGLEDAIQALKACIGKKKGDQISRQGPQEKRRAEGPGIPVSAIVPSIPAGEQAPEQPYRVQIPREVLIKPEEALDLSRKVTLSVEELLALSPAIRRYFNEVTMVRCVENEKEEVVKASTVAVYLVEEGPSEPKEASSKVFLFEESLVGEEVAVEARKEKNEELADKESEVSHRKSVFEVCEEKEGFPLFSHVTDPHRNKGSSVYSQFRSIDTWSSMYLFPPPVSSCPSFAANLLRSVFIESTVVKASPQIPRKKKSRPRAVKKVERLLYDPGGGGSVQFNAEALDHSQHRDSTLPSRLEKHQASWEQIKPFVANVSQGNSEAKKSQPVVTEMAMLPQSSKRGELAQFEVFWMALPARSHLETPPNEETRVRITMLQHEGKNPHAPFVKVLRAIATMFQTNESPTPSKAVWVRYKITDCRKLVPANFLDCQNPQKIFLLSLCIPQSPSPGLYPSIRCFDVPSDHRDDSRGSEMKKSQRLLKDMVLVPYDFKHGELVSFEAFWMYVLAQAYLAKLVKAASLVCSQIQDTALLPQSEIVFAIETSTAVAVMSQIIERARPNAATPVKRETRVKCTRDVPAVTSEKTCIAYWEEKLLRRRKRRIRTMFEDPAEVTYLVPIVESTLTTAKLMVERSPEAPRTTRRSGCVFSEDSKCGEKDGNESFEEDLGGRSRRRRRRRLWAKATFVKGLRSGRSGSKRSLKGISRERDVGWKELNLAFNLGVDIEQNTETKRRYPEPMLEGWRKKRSLPASGRRQFRQQHSHRSIPLHTIAEETRVSPRHSFIPTPLRTRRLQTRFKGSRGPIQTPCEVESKGPRLVGNHCIRTEWNVETKPRLRGLAVIIRKTKGGVWTLFGWCSGKIACRVPMPALSCKVIGYQSIAKIAIGRRYCRDGKPRKTQLKSSSPFFILRIP